VFENRGIFGSKRDEVTGEWRKPHNGELKDLYSSPTILRVIKSTIMRWGECSKYGVGERCVQGFGGETLRQREKWGDPGVDGWIIIRWIFRKWDVGVWTGFSWLRIETGGGHV
jgi:hypothetical protein